MSALTRNGMGAGGGPDDNAAQAGHVVAPPVLGKQSPGFPNSADYAVLAPALTASWANNGGTGGHDGRDEAIEAVLAARMIGPLQASGNDGRGHRIGADEAAGGQMVAEGQVVRRLTPTECERLQALPDGWTAITWRGRPAADSLRYAALGDAVTASVGAWVGARLAAELAS